MRWCKRCKTLAEPFSELCYWHNTRPEQGAEPEPEKPKRKVKVRVKRKSKA